MDLGVLLQPKLDLERLTQVLDELGAEGRAHTIHTWGKHQLRTLYDAIAGYRPMTLDDLVPSQTPPLVEVIHDLKNSLPLFSSSQKRFCRPDLLAPDAPPELWGYNHTSTNVFTGPGYFVARAAATPGEVLIDYQVLPGRRVPTWPRIVSNKNRLGIFVYHGLTDVMRSLSRHVAVGRAQRGDAPLDAWFAISRRDIA